MGVDFLLLLTAAIWGFAFVAQRIGMASVGPFTFNAIRFLLGGLSLIPLAVYLKIGRGNCSFRQVLTAGIISGLVLFFGASLQQVGIVETTAGNAGFITGLYVVIVPVLGLVLRQRTGWATWLPMKCIFTPLAYSHWMSHDSTLSHRLPSGGILPVPWYRTGPLASMFSPHWAMSSGCAPQPAMNPSA